MNLYKINESIQRVANEIIEQDGEFTDDQLASLEQLELSLKDKCINIAYVVQGLGADVSQIDAEIKRLQALKKVKSNAVDRLKDAVKDSMIHNEITEFKTSTHTINFRKSESVNIIDEDLVPAQFKTISQTLKIDKKELKKALVDGPVEGAEISKNLNLNIK